MSGGQVPQCGLDDKGVRTVRATNKEIVFLKADGFKAGCPKQEPNGVDDAGFACIVLADEDVQIWIEFPV